MQVCKKCQKEFIPSKGLKNYCSTFCAKSRAGENNPNFGKKMIDAYPEAYKVFKAKVKVRGQGWTEEMQKAHSAKMKGSSNWMRGKHHKQETKDYVSKVKLDMYKNGLVKLCKRFVSNPEVEIAGLLIEQDVTFIPQYQIKNVSYIYDFYIPSKNLVIEFNGDYWHANPKRYKPNTLLKIQGQGEVAVEKIWERDKLKREAVTNLGYNYECIWQSDYTKNKTLVLELIKKYD